MDIFEYTLKQEILDGSRKEWSRIILKFQSGEELTKGDIEFMLISGAGMIGIIQDELLTPAFDKIKGEGPVH